MAEKISIAEELFHKGELIRATEYLGCCCIKKHDEFIYTFRTYAPRAEAVFLASDYNGWADSLIPLTRSEGGVWECTVRSPFALDGYAYKFVIRANGSETYKGDPYAVYSKGGYDGASVIWTSSYEWTDTDWLLKREKKVGRAKGALALPINVYTVYPSDFTGMKEDRYPTYRELADVLIPYLKYMGYTHLRLLSVFNTALDVGTGGILSPSWRYGTPDDLKYLINSLHNSGIGIILDWNATYIADVDWGLGSFDGGYLYESKDAPHRLDTALPEVRSYLASALNHIIREYHPDGVYINGLDSAIGSDKSLFGYLTRTSRAEREDILLISVGNDSPTKKRCTDVTYNTSLAYALSDYLGTAPYQRTDKHSCLVTQYSAKDITPIDLVTHSGRAGSFINGIYGSYEDKFRQMRAALLYFMCLPSKKEVFMGTEFAQFSDRERGRTLEWFMLGYPSHKRMRQYISALNRFYIKNDELWVLDYDKGGFELISSAPTCGTLIFKRSSKSSHVFVAVNLSGTTQCVKIPSNERLSCVFSSEESSAVDRMTEVNEDGNNYISISLLPYSARIYKPIHTNNKIII